MASRPASLPSAATKTTVAPSAAQFVGLRMQMRRLSMPSPARKCALPMATRLPSTVPSAPLPAGESKSVDLRRARAFLFRSGDDGAGERMLARVLDAGGEPQHVVRVEARRRNDRRHRRLAFGQRAGLVDHQRIDLLHALQRLGVLDQDAGLRAAPDADHDRHRRREAERAGAGDDQHRDRGDEAVGEARLRPEPGPGGEGERARPRSPPARTSRRPDRRAAGSARASAAPAPPSARSATSSVSRPTLSARITKEPLLVDRAGDHLARPAPW